MLCLHVMFAFACVCDKKISIHDTKWRCLHLMLTFACHAENVSDTHFVHLHLRHHRLNVKVDVDAHAHANVRCKQSLMVGEPYDRCGFIR